MDKIMGNKTLAVKSLLVHFPEAYSRMPCKFGECEFFDNGKQLIVICESVDEYECMVFNLNNVFYYEFSGKKDE